MAGTESGVLSSVRTGEFSYYRSLGMTLQLSALLFGNSRVFGYCTSSYIRDRTSRGLVHNKLSRCSKTLYTLEI